MGWNVKNSSNDIVPLEVQVPVPLHRVKYKNAENLFETD